MNNKAFTLVELIAIIVVLAAIFLVSFPTFINMTKSNEEKKYTQMVEDLCLAGETYIYSNIEDFEELSTSSSNIQITVESLINDGIVNKNLTNPETKKSVKNDNLSYTVLGDKSLHCEYKSSSINIILPMGLTPIIYNGTNWEVADISKEWYNYSNQEWANAAIISDGVSKTPGTQLTDLNNQVKAMFVYIPRYEYKIEGEYGKGGTSSALPGEIEVIFVSKSQKEPTSGYTIHPAFTFGEKELDGIWVGKFEMSHVEGINKSLSCNATSCSTAGGLRVLPDVQPLHSNSISSLFYAIRTMGKEFKISTDTHMIKNSEWGAVAYLSQSKYGKYGNDDYYGTYQVQFDLDGNNILETYTLSYKEIYMNKESNYKTGYSNGTPSESNTYEQCPYDDLRDRGFGKGACGGGASTTGNITGAYDMSGGSVEYVMGYYNFGNTIWGANSNKNDAGFENAPDSKYYNEYTEQSIVSCTDTMCKGHALDETEDWYYDHHKEGINKTNPWILRSGDKGYGIFEGIFYSLGSIGGGSATRPVIVSN